MEAAPNITPIYYKSKKISLIILAITAIVCSRMLFFFFNNPEGPNLLIVTVLALAIFLATAAAYVYLPLKLNSIKRLSLAISMQILSVAVLYFFM